MTDLSASSKSSCVHSLLVTVRILAALAGELYSAYSDYLFDRSAKKSCGKFELICGALGQRYYPLSD